MPCCLGCEWWTPERRLWKVDCTGDSPASDVAVVVALFFGHVDGEEQAAGVSGVDGGSDSSQIVW